MSHRAGRILTVATLLALGCAVPGAAREAGPDEIEAPAGARVEDRAWVEVEAPDREARTRAADLGLSIEEVSPGIAAGVATP